jgi:hypothetical protein
MRALLWAVILIAFGIDIGVLLGAFVYTPELGVLAVALSLMLLAGGGLGYWIAIIDLQPRAPKTTEGDER